MHDDLERKEELLKRIERDTEKLFFFMMLAGERHERKWSGAPFLYRHFNVMGDCAISAELTECAKETNSVCTLSMSVDPFLFSRMNDSEEAKNIPADKKVVDIVLNSIPIYSQGTVTHLPGTKEVRGPIVEKFTEFGLKIVCTDEPRPVMYHCHRMSLQVDLNRLQQWELEALSWLLNVFSKYIDGVKG